MQEVILSIAPFTTDELGAYQIYCDKRFRALGIQKYPNANAKGAPSAYVGDEEMIEIFETELWRAGLLAARSTED